MQTLTDQSLPDGIRANLDALDLAKALSAGGRQPTGEESKVLRAYSGWGRFATYFGDHPLRNELRTRVREVAGDDAFAALRASILTSYYTDPKLAELLWAGLHRMGLREGRVLEPAGGHGALIDAAPASIAPALSWTAIESCPATGCVLAARFPRAQVIVAPFETVPTHARHFTAVIANPPFLDVALRDRSDPRVPACSMHSFFLFKSILALQPGGILAAVVSRYFLDSRRARPVRAALSEHARLIGAIRLPSGTFANAGTDVVVDLVFMQRLADGMPGNGEEWGECVQWSGEVFINRWFVDTPQAVCGALDVVAERHGGDTLMVRASGDWLADAGCRVAELPADVLVTSPALNDAAATGPVADPSVRVDAHDDAPVLGYAIDALGRAVRRLGDAFDMASEGTVKRWCVVELPKRKVARLSGMLELWRLLSRVMAHDLRDGEDTLTAEVARATLRRRHEAFTGEFGAIHSLANRFMADDPRFSLLLGLELDYDPGVSERVATRDGVRPRPASWRRAEIMERRVGSALTLPSTGTTPEVAIALSMAHHGQVDLGFIGGLCGLTRGALLNALEGQILCVDPSEDQWQLSGVVLSGDVVAKRQAMEALPESLRRLPQVAQTIAALADARPALVAAHDIEAPFAAPWLGNAVFEAFLSEALGLRGARARYVANRWAMSFGPLSHASAHSQWGTARVGVDALLPKLANAQPLAVYDTLRGARVFNAEASALVEQKGLEIREAWDAWIMADPQRRAHIEQVYNETFNRFTQAEPQGTLLVDAEGLLPGQDPGVRLDEHQLNAIFRAVTEGRLLFDHATGAGKTFAGIASAILLKRFGRASKPLIVVPNHLVHQWRSAAATLFPLARVLCARDEDLAGAGARRAFFAHLTFNPWDLVILPVSALRFIGLPHGYATLFLRELVNELVSAIGALGSETGFTADVRKLERQRAKLTKKLTEQLEAPARDCLVDFADTGIDAVFVDEWHESFKNLAFATKHTNVAGMGNAAGSQRAIDLWARCRYIQDHTGGAGVFLLTATPVANAVSELWTVARFLDYDGLCTMGLAHLDAWLSLYAQVSTEYEINAAGAFSPKARLRRYTNLPELTAHYRTFAHTVSKAQIAANYMRRGQLDPEPPVRGGQAMLISAPRSPVQDALMAELLERAEHMGSKGPEEDNWLALCSDAAKLSLEPRLLDPGLADFERSKSALCAGQVARLYHKWNDQRGTQIVFLDLGVPGGSAPFNVYADLKAKMVAMGVSRDDIAFIHDARSDIMRARLVERMNRGEIRVLLTSTAKGGTGLNVQQRIVAVHHLDIPWRPDQAEQRTGRALRRGNLLYQADPQGFRLEVLFYGTERTLDAFRYQALEAKAAFIAQLRSGSLCARHVDDAGDGMVSSYGQMKALIADNPLLLDLFRCEQTIKQLETLERAHRRRCIEAQAFLDQHADVDARTARALEKVAADIATVARYNGAIALERNGQDYRGETLQGALSDALNEAFGPYFQWRLRGSGIDLGTLNGLTLSAHTLSNGTLVIELSGASSFAWQTSYAPGASISVPGLIARCTHALATLPFEVERIQSRHQGITEHLQACALDAAAAFPQSEALRAQRVLHARLTQALGAGARSLEDSARTPAEVRVSRRSRGGFARPGSAVAALPIAA